jgi:hypothetical protein
MVITGNDDHIASDVAAAELLALPRASRTPVSAWLLPDIIFRIFNTAICVPYSNHSLSTAANLGL